MKVIEQLNENKSAYNVGIPMIIKDVITKKFIYCGKGYEQVLKEMDEADANARFLFDKDDKDCIIIYCIKDLEYYNDGELTGCFSL